MNFISLFAGVGGFDIAFERAGMTCVYQVEIDRNCNRVLGRHWPSVQRMSDVRKFTKRDYAGPVDLVCGGFPCTDLSVAGRRAGLDGKQSGLWFEFLRVIQEFTPKWVVIENVFGLLSSYSGDDPPDDLRGGDQWQTAEESDMGIILRGLAESGYMGAYRILDAQYWGVPQRRRRVFIVASLGDWAGPAQVLFESESSPWDIAPSREAGTRVAGSLAPGAHASGFNGQDADRGNVAYTGTGAGYYNEGEHTSALQKSQTPDVLQSDVRRFLPVECERLQGLPDQHTAHDASGKPISDSARYRMLGNAVAVLVVEWLGRRIMAVSKPG